MDQGFNEGKEPFAGNMAIATMLFKKDRKKFEYLISSFPIVEIIYSDFLLYPLSGGFEKPAICPYFLVPAVHLAEKILKPAASFFAYRILVVMEKLHET